MSNNFEIKEAAADLSTKLDKFDWFYDIEHNDKEITVYVNLMNADIISKVPDRHNGINVKVAFAQYLLCEEKYAKVPRDTGIIELLENSN